MTVRLKAISPGGGGLLDILGPDGRSPEGLSAELEACFARSHEVWLKLAADLPADAVNDRGHFGTCAPNVSDFGLLTGWAGLVTELGARDEVYDVHCADPWLFRHLAGLPGVSAGSPPSLLPVRLKAAVRGWLARGRVAVTMFRNCLAARGQKTPVGGRWLMVYGHPASTSDGRDGYFGELMQQQPDFRRILHVDCAVPRGRELAADGRTFLLHGYGSPLYALSLIFRKWRLPESSVKGRYEWLVRRALALDSGYAGAAMIAWQIHCQRRWLATISPDVVFWPWENHGWERSFCRDLRASGGTSVGYQHSVVGQQWNLGPGSNPDGAASLPDRIFCNGASGFRQLLEAGHPEARLVLAGAWRFPKPEPVTWSADAPVFVAAPFDLAVARQMLEACRAVPDRRFVVRVHPMTPLEFTEEGNIAAATGPLSAQKEVSAVVYAATTVGLEAWMLGLPVLRFQPEARIAIDILPDDASVAASDHAGLADNLNRVIGAGAVEGRQTGDIFSLVDRTVWEEYPLSTRDHPVDVPAKEVTV